MGYLTMVEQTAGVPPLRAQVSSFYRPTVAASDLEALIPW